MVKLDSRYHTASLDAMLKYYMASELSSFSPEKDMVYVAHRFVESTQVKLGEILGLTGVMITTAYFDFDPAFSETSTFSFCDGFECFVRHVVKIVRYIMGFIR